VESARAGHPARRCYVQAVERGISDVTDAFKLLPGHERHYAARSEYLFKLLQPPLDDVLFLGSDYEAAFDRFEILLALEYAHQDNRATGDVWGPVGRFGWKYRRGSSGNPYAELVSEAAAMGSAWPPLVAGLFGGSSERFQELAKNYAALLARLSWF
jgi:hypothetical protein